MKFSFLYLLFILVLLASCEPKKKIDPRVDDSLYERLDKGFYKGKKDGQLYIKTIGDLTPNDTASKSQSYYLQVPDIDVPSFERLAHAGFYAKDKNHVYIWETKTEGEVVTILQHADAATFTAIGYRWAKDSNTVFYNGIPLKGLNPASTVPVCFEEMDSSLIYIDFIRDDDRLFYREKEILVPKDMDVTKLYCKSDLLGNSFLALGEQLYVIRNNTLDPY